MPGRPWPQPSPQRASTGLALGLALVLTGSLFFAGEAWAQTMRGVFGVTVAISGDGLFNPTIVSARIVAVAPNMPAAQAGVGVGDAVLEVDNRRIPGARARDLEPLSVGKKVGEVITLKLLRSSGESYVVRMVAVAPRAP